MPMYILMVVDSNGESEIVALWLVVYEDKDTISHLMNIFEKHNDTTNTKINVSLDQAKRIKRTKEMWICDYTGYNDAFGDLFDSD